VTNETEAAGGLAPDSTALVRMAGLGWVVSGACAIRDGGPAGMAVGEQPAEEAAIEGTHESRVPVGQLAEKAVLHVDLQPSICEAGFDVSPGSREGFEPLLEFLSGGDGPCVAGGRSATLGGLGTGGGSPTLSGLGLDHSGGGLLTHGGGLPGRLGMEAPAVVEAHPLRHDGRGLAEAAQRGEQEIGQHLVVALGKLNVESAGAS